MELDKVYKEEEDRDKQGHALACLRKLLDSLIGEMFLSPCNNCAENSYENMGRGMSISAMRHLYGRYFSQRAWNEERQNRQSEKKWECTEKETTLAHKAWDSVKKVEDYIRKTQGRLKQWREDVENSKPFCFFCFKL